MLKGTGFTSQRSQQASNRARIPWSIFKTAKRFAKTIDPGQRTWPKTGNPISPSRYFEKSLILRVLIQRQKTGTYILSVGTQTDQDMSTQTEPQYLRPPRRRVQSDWELSDDGSDEEIAIIKARAKRRHRIIKPRKIRTPILGENLSIK